ncbi:PP2C family protein-serine/threonine phosphatase [Nonomuraea fuscirosea]|uniref:PP2C family protein-serine/threonine phosphatase n=1 Tax=Nonomuraea fuscirosea TaxID=1291556 RepID=UPI0037226C34
MTSSTPTGPMPAIAPPATQADVRAVMFGPAGYIAYGSHIGRRRASNNDWVTVRIGDRFTALVVADGVGAGVGAGDAARVACEVAAATAAQTGFARVACQAARTAVAGFFDEDGGYATSTLTVAVLSNHTARSDGAASWVELAWLGDSSAWLLTADDDMPMDRLTTPHNPDDDPHMVLRHVMDGEPDRELLDLEEQPARRLLLCSDGLDGYVDHEVIERIVRGAETVHDARDALIAAALEAGGRDNVTVVVAELGGVGEPGRGVVKECPVCGRQDPPVTTLGDGAGTIETDCCHADVTDAPRLHAE